MKTVAKDKILNTIIEQLENGTVPWRKPWNTKLTAPRNGASGHYYQGLNFFVLLSTDYTDQRWYTFNQAKKLGGNIKEGEKGTSIFFWSFFDTEDENQKPKSVPYVKLFTVFNHAQCEGLPEEEVKAPENKLASDIVEGFKNKPEIIYGKNLACYIPSSDKIYMPSFETFHSEGEFYSTLFHEMVHSTGHETRLDRKLSTNFGDEDYSTEELIAELGAAYLCAQCGIDNTIENTSSYINNWLKKLRADKNALFTASTKSQKAVNMILGLE